VCRGAEANWGVGGLADVFVEKCTWPLDHHGFQWLGSWHVNAVVSSPHLGGSKNGEVFRSRKYKGGRDGGWWEGGT
jgi:hypothetical protein